LTIESKLLSYGECTFHQKTIQPSTEQGMNIHIIGSLCNTSPIDEHNIQRLLDSERIPLNHHGEFTGKPDTQLYIDAHWALKINRKHKYPSLLVAQKWCRIQIDKEQRYQIYHPQRTWFVVEDAKQWVVANITPRMQSLDKVDFQHISSAKRLYVLSELLRIYMTFATTFALKLDEGLSNFAIHDEQIFYLDDDIYPWDNFSSFSAMLGHWIRISPSLSMHTALWKELGGVLQGLLQTHSSDAEDMVHEALIDQIVGKHESFKNTFLTALRPSYKITMSQHAMGAFRNAEPIAIIADVHANMPAFQAILQHLDKLGIQQHLILGDIVGYGPNPRECIALIQQRKMFCIRGNHDHYVAHDGNVRVAMGSMAKWTADWTLQQLNGDEKLWLGALPVRHITPTWMAVHGSPVDKSFFNGYVYNMTSERNLEHLKKIDMPICLHGHSHIQGIYAHQAGKYLPFNSNIGHINLAHCETALICPGSVGQPRNNAHTITAEAAIFHPDKRTVEMLNIPYDMSPVIADMEKFNFPPQLIQRLKES